MSASTDTPTAVVLFNLGGPADLASVEPFLVNLFSDREIIELPFGARLQPVMARVIAKLRGPAVRRNYERIGGGSPQLRITTAQAAALDDRLSAGCRNRGSYRVFVAMRYTRPSCEDAIEAIAAAGIRRIVTLSLFPHYSKPTTGSSRNEFARVLAKAVWSAKKFQVGHIDRYADDPAYLDALTGGEVALVVIGGLLYTAGAVVYALHKPNPWPSTFGYHEIFHALVVVAALAQYLAVFSLAG